MFLPTICKYINWCKEGSFPPRQNCMRVVFQEGSFPGGQFSVHVHVHTSKTIHLPAKTCQRPQLDIIIANE